MAVLTARQMITYLESMYPTGEDKLVVAWWDKTDMYENLESAGYVLDDMTGERIDELWETIAEPFHDGEVSRASEEIGIQLTDHLSHALYPYERGEKPNAPELGVDLEDK